MEETNIREIWQQEANLVYQPIRWLPFWRPRVLLKRGRFSPWFWPPLWLPKSGAFNLFFLVIISDDLLDCAPRHRRAIIAHECGHLSGFHWLIWMMVIALALNKTVQAGLASIGDHFGPWAALGAFLVLLVLIPISFVALRNWFEHQADDYACARVGSADVITTLSWLNNRMFGDQGSPLVNARISR